tara:strand:- start:21 stop:389 length:369 start_codon:yes stop_codon:yes gene_type:complete
MPSITVNFNFDLNESVQLGDTLHYVNPTNDTLQGGDVIPFNNDGIIEVGEITTVNYATNTIVAEIQNSTALPTGTSFFLFSKDNRANMASLLGYYAEVEFTNNSTEKAELFSAGSEIFESSK